MFLASVTKVGVENNYCAQVIYKKPSINLQEIHWCDTHTHTPSILGLQVQQFISTLTLQFWFFTFEDKKM